MFFLHILKHALFDQAKLHKWHCFHGSGMSCLTKVNKICKQRNSALNYNVQYFKYFQTVGVIHMWLAISNPFYLTHSRIVVDFTHLISCRSAYINVYKYLLSDDEASDIFSINSSVTVSHINMRQTRIKERVWLRRTKWIGHTSKRQ